MDPPRKLVVEVVGARNLMSKDGSGSASAFCMVEYDGNRRKTSSKLRDLSPTWGQKFDFLITDLTMPGTLEINIYNERKGGTRRHEFLGRVQIQVADVVKQGQETLQWLRLGKRGWFSHVKGELGLKVWYEDPEPAPPPPELKPESPPEEKPKGPPPEDKVPKEPEQPKNVSTVAPAKFHIKEWCRETWDRLSSTIITMISRNP